ncbi:hypothetical protein [Acinetobacter guillouiae]|uniref:hypothetical protein n=1 Tax=Acinetobacter guillouiae TaxID=106649 RepID=UPI002E1C4B10
MNDELLLERERTIKRLQEKFGLSEDQIIRSEDVEASGEKYLTFDGPNAVKYWNDLKELCEKEFGPQETQ